MYGNILNERIRIDAASLIPELACNNIRFSGSIIRNIIPDVYSEKINIKNGTLYYDGRRSAYNGDNLTLGDYFDIEFTLPPLPPHVYEVRVGFSQTSAATSDVVTLPERLCQIYIDGKPEGVPFEIRYLDSSVGYKTQTGYIADRATFDNGMENDKHMRYFGWMKAPVTFYGLRGLPARHDKNYIRKIITRKHFNTGKHKIRFRIVSNSDSDLFLDYIEFVPLKIINDPTKPEDRH